MFLKKFLIEFSTKAAYTHQPKNLVEIHCKQSKVCGEYFVFAEGEKKEELQPFIELSENYLFSSNRRQFKTIISRAWFMQWY